MDSILLTAPDGQMVQVKPAIITDSKVVAASLSLPAGYCCKDNGSGALVLTGDGDEANGQTGVVFRGLDNSAVAAVSQTPASFVVVGLVRVVAKAAIAAGAQIALAAEGKVKTIGAGTFNLKVGRALTAATNDGDVLVAYVNFI
jgi:hypothetical protein